MPGPSYPQFQKLVTDRVAAGNPEREDSPAYLLKQAARAGERDFALEETQPPSRRRLKELVTGLKHQSSAAEFPAQCAAALDRLRALIEDASDRGSFGLAQSNAEGEVLLRILVLAAVTNKHGPTLRSLYCRVPLNRPDSSPQRGGGWGCGCWATSI